MGFFGFVCFDLCDFCCLAFLSSVVLDVLLCCLGCCYGLFVAMLLCYWLGLFYCCVGCLHCCCYGVSDCWLCGLVFWVIRLLLYLDGIAVFGVGFAVFDLFSCWWFGMGLLLLCSSEYGLGVLRYFVVSIGVVVCYSDLWFVILNCFACVFVGVAIHRVVALIDLICWIVVWVCAALSGFVLMLRGFDCLLFGYICFTGWVLILVCVFTVLVGLPICAFTVFVGCCVDLSVDGFVVFVFLRLGLV